LALSGEADFPHGLGYQPTYIQAAAAGVTRKASQNLVSSFSATPPIVNKPKTAPARTAGRARGDVVVWNLC
jgi:hypothetical protein